jgi:thymidylate synthase (FAD)
MREAGAQPQEAREVLNNSFKTHIRITRNFRAMREFLTLRCAKTAHPHIKEICIPLLLLMKQKFPIIFDDIKYDEEFLEHMDPWNSYIKEFVIPVRYLEEGEH